MFLSIWLLWAFALFNACVLIFWSSTDEATACSLIKAATNALRMTFQIHYNGSISVETLRNVIVFFFGKIRNWYFYFLLTISSFTNIKHLAIFLAPTFFMFTIRASISKITSVTFRLQ